MDEKNLLADLSYSKIYDIIKNDDNAQQFLTQLDNAYQKAFEEEKSIEKELQSIKTQRGLQVSAFLKAHKIIVNSSSKKLSFLNGNSVVVIEYIDNDTINYERIELSDLDKQIEEKED